MPRDDALNCGRRSQASREPSLSRALNRSLAALRRTGVKVWGPRKKVPPRRGSAHGGRGIAWTVHVPIERHRGKREGRRPSRPGHGRGQQRRRRARLVGVGRVPHPLCSPPGVFLLVLVQNCFVCVFEPVPKQTQPPRGAAQSIGLTAGHRNTVLRGWPTTLALAKRSGVASQSVSHG